MASQTVTLKYQIQCPACLYYKARVETVRVDQLRHHRPAHGMLCNSCMSKAIRDMRRSRMVIFEGKEVDSTKLEWKHRKIATARWAAPFDLAVWIADQREQAERQGRAHGGTNGRGTVLDAKGNPVSPRKVATDPELALPLQEVMP